MLQAKKINTSMTYFVAGALRHKKTKYVDPNVEVYKMNHKRRGTALIFNNVKIYQERNNTEACARNLSQTFQMMGFDVELIVDATLQVIIEKLKSVASQDHTNNDCLAVAVLSTGTSGYLKADNMFYPAQMLWMPFLPDSCPGLIDKPKIFFLQTYHDSSYNGIHGFDQSINFSFPDIMVVHLFYNFKRGMPRSKRRAPSSTNHHTTIEMSPSAHEEGISRHPSKRLRHTSSARRYTKTEDVSTTSSFSQKRCITWFREYTTPDDSDTLGPEGMEKFCEDIGVEPENVVMLVLAYKMNARQMGFFTLSEWLKGLSDLQCDSISKIQQKLEYLRNQLNDPHTFKGIYRYAYDFARDKDQRSMDMETARVMLQLLLGKHWPLFTQFAQFLDQSKYKVINKDQWCNILEFSRTINHDLSNYDLDGAWPVMLDEFVEWLKIQRGEEASSTETRGS